MEENKKPEVTNVTVKKPSLLSELLKYSMEEVFIPKSKDMMRDFMTSMVNMFSDAATKSIDKAIYKDEVPRRGNSNNSGTFVSHTKYNTTVVKNDDRPRKETITNRSSIDVNYIWVDTEKQAQEIIAALKEEIEFYGKAKVATLYEMLRDENGNKIQTSFTDYKFGWTNANEISYYRDKGKYFIDLPKPRNIENIN